MSQPFDWNKLISHLGSQDLSFDSLSKQLFRKEYQNQGEYHPVGVDGQTQNGVEAIVILPNKDEIGVQAKWFSNGTISGTYINRRQQIKKSFGLALKNRKNLKKWILSIPHNFDDAERKWWKKNFVNKYPQIEFELWNDDKLHELMHLPKNSGIRHWFFGELEFNEKWFETRVKSVSESLSSKYKPSLHVDGNADTKIDFALGSKELVESINAQRKKLASEIKITKKIEEELLTDISDKTVEFLIKEIRQPLKKFFSTSNKFSKQLSQFTSFLGNGNLSEASRFEFINDLLEREAEESGYGSSILFKRINKITHLKNYVSISLGDKEVRFKLVGWLDRDTPFNVIQGDNYIEFEIKLEFIEPLAENIALELRKDKKFTKEKDLEERILHFFKTKLVPYKEDIDEATNKLSPLIDSIENCINIHSQVGDDISYFRQQEIIFLANPGIGKTHLVLSSCQKQIKNGKPATVTIGSQISNQDNLKRQICEQWGIPSGFTWSETVSALEAYAESRNERLLFAFDALNESQYWDSIVTRDLNDTIRPLLDSPWFCVILTARRTYADPLFGSDHPKNSYYLSNDMDIEEYREKYFSYYKIQLKTTSPTLRKHLQDRFFVTLIAKTYGNPENEGVAEISLDNFDITTLFEDYLQKTDLEISKNLKAPSGCSIVRKKLLKLCGFLFEKNIMQLSKYKAFELIEEKNPADVRTSDSWLVEMINEGLLVDLTWKKGVEVLEFSHQRLGEYLIACYIVENNNERSIYEKIRLHSNNPRIVDILEMVGILTPKFINKHLHQIFQSSQLIDSAQLQLLFEISPKFISKNELSWFKHYFQRADSDRKSSIFSNLLPAVSFPDYPLNANFVSSLLHDLSMADRDVSWSEWLRDQDSYELYGFIDDCEVQFEKNSDKERLKLFARYLMWFLTSTNKKLRDKATKALYLFGRTFPDELFTLAIKSLGINDPYIADRMLAASYGVTMALHVGEDNGKFIDGPLKVYVDALYAKLFAVDAESSTTHILMRDYARHTFEIYNLHRPSQFSKTKVKHFRPPYKRGGIRKWETSEDIDKGKYRDGNSPLGFDWGNYTLGRLVKDRGPYQETDEFKKVRGQILWRIYKLGYSLYVFGELDKRIARSDFSFRRGESSSKVERYGKKYCWIAFYELAGYRFDKGLLRDDDLGARISDVDIDPSFPQLPPKQKVEVDSLLDEKKKLPAWVSDKTAFDINDLLQRKSLGKSPSTEWILLDGFISEKNKSLQMGAMLSVTGFLIDDKESDDFIDHFLNKNDPYGREEKEIPSNPSLYYTFAGEIPWSDTFPSTYIDNMDFTIDESKKIMKKISYKFDFSKYFEDENEESSGTSEETVNEVIDYDEMVAQGIIRQFKIQPTTIIYNWESYHSDLNQASGIKVLCKEIAKHLDLYLKPQSFIFYDQSGNQATVLIENGNRWKSGEEFVFIRKDLLDKYLKENKKALVWLVWGERSFEAKDGYGSKELEEFRSKHGTNYSRYYEAIKYS